LKRPALEIAIEGVGLCAPGLPSWNDAADFLRGVREYEASAYQRPSPALLSPNERRRAPDSVLLALAVAEQACAMARREPGKLPNVFASAYGDLAISDYLCTELARAPLDISPTKFHNSVHNAPAGYWTIATHCMASSSAVSAGTGTFGASLLEAALLVCREATPVLLVVFDTMSQGPLADAVAAEAPFAAAFVLAPQPTAGSAAVRLGTCGASKPGLAPLPASLHSLQATSPAAATLPLLAALARREATTLTVAAGVPQPANGATQDAYHLQLEISF
jgi:hypothetical protein